MLSSGARPKAFHQMPMTKLTRVLPCVVITPWERAQLLQWVRRRTSPQRLVVRSRIVLLASEGLPVSAIARRLHVTPATARLWCNRFARKGVLALAHDAPGRGRKPGMSQAPTLAVLRAMLQVRSSDATCTTRSLARQSGASASTVCRVWKQYGLVSTSSVTTVARAIEKAISETPSMSK